MSFLLRFFRPKSNISNPMEVVHAIHLNSDLKWEFDPQYDAKEVFQKLQVIGKGGFGTVCKVLHIPSQTILAGKLINPKLVNSPNSKKEIDHEVTLMKEVESDYTIRYYGSVQFEGSMMILMEYCDCGSLRNILDAREQALTEDQIAIVMRDLLLGLQIIHTRYRIVHRDIKAANILLTSSGGIRIADFGVSRRFEKTGTIHTMTIVGTPYWMAPEVINGTAYSFPADLWSVGITAVELAEGAPPYVELAPTKAMIEIFVKGFPGYRFKKMHSQEFMDFVSHCVQKKDTDRWDIPRLLEHPFIKKAEKMQRVEVLGDLIRCGLKVTKSQAGEGSRLFSSKNNNQQSSTGSEIFSFSTQKNASGAPNLNSATNFDTLGNSGCHNQRGVQLASGTSFDTFSIGAQNGQAARRDGQSFDSFAAAHKSGFDSAALNSGTNFGLSNNGGGFDSAALNSGTNFGLSNGGGFDSAALNSGTNFGLSNGSGFDSAALNSGTNFGLSNGSGFDSAALNSGANFGGRGFDSAALNSGTSFDSFAANYGNGSGFDSAALNSGANFDSFAANYGNGSGFDSAALNSGANFDSFAANYGNGGRFDSAALNSGANFAGSGFDSAALNSGTSFDSFAKGAGGKAQPGFDSAALGPGSNFKSSAGFDSFAANYAGARNGFDSAALGGGQGPAGFDSFAANYAGGNKNGFDSAALNSSTNFDSFAANYGNNRNGFDSASLDTGGGQGPAGFDSFAANYAGGNKNGFDSAALNSSTNFDSFAANYAGAGNKNGFDSAALNSSTNFDSFAANYAGAGNKNGFDSAALNSGTNFDSFAANYAGGNKNGFDSAALNSGTNFDSFAANYGNNRNGFDSASLDTGSAQSPAGFDSFAANYAGAGNKSGFDSAVLNSGANYGVFVGRGAGFDSASLNSGSGFDSFAASYAGGDKSGFDSASLNSGSGFDSFAQPGGGAPPDIRPSSGFDTFAKDHKSSTPSGAFVAPPRDPDQLNSGASFSSFISTDERDAGYQQGFDSFKLDSPPEALEPPRPLDDHQGEVTTESEGAGEVKNAPLEKSHSQPINQQDSFNLRSPRYMTLQPSQPPQPPHSTSQEPISPSSTQTLRPNRSRGEIPHVTFAALPTDGSNRHPRMPYVNYGSVVESAKLGRTLPPVVYQQDDSMLAQERLRQQKAQLAMQRKLIQPFTISGKSEEDEEKVPTWSPPKPIVAFLIVAVVIYGPEGFVIALILVMAMSFFVHFGKKDVKVNEGLATKKFQTG